MVKKINSDEDLKIYENEKHFKVFCEGDTEYHYIDEMKVNMIWNWEKLGRRGSNINEFFDVITSF